MRVIQVHNLSAASFDSGESVVFLVHSGDVLVCSTQYLDQWREGRGGELADSMLRLGYLPEEGPAKSQA